MEMAGQQGFSLFRSIGWFDAKKDSFSGNPEVYPSLNIQLDKEIYRPGDTVNITFEISTSKVSNEYPDEVTWSNQLSSFFLDNFRFEVKGIERLDCQWFATRKPFPWSMKRIGKHLFLDHTVSPIALKVLVSSGWCKTYAVRFELPKVLPPSYRGVIIRYSYYVRIVIFGRWIQNNEHTGEHLGDLIQVEGRVPLQIVVAKKIHNLLTEEGNLLITADQLDVFWKEMDADSEWVLANANLEGTEEGHDNSKDEGSSVSSSNPRIEAEEHTNIRSCFPPSQLSLAEVVNDPGASEQTPLLLINSSSTPSPTQQGSALHSKFHKDDTGPLHTPKLIKPSACRLRHASSLVCFKALPFFLLLLYIARYQQTFPTAEGSARGRSYNIKIDDQILLWYSPKNSDSSFYFGDMIGGLLTFSHGGVRRCLEVAITLEIVETVAESFIHPSRRNSPTITKVQSEHHEVVADLVQTSFIFSIPIDGPVSFSTPKLSVQWLLRFKFFTTPKGLDFSRYEHPLLVAGREEVEWLFPFDVHAPPPRIQAPRKTNEKHSSLGNMFCS